MEVVKEVVSGMRLRCIHRGHNETIGCMLEVSVERKTSQHLPIRVHTLCQEEAVEAWQGYHKWKNPDGRGRVPCYDMDLR
jgi:hypothetical protein